MQWCESLADAGGFFPYNPNTHLPARIDPDPHCRICTPLCPHQHLGPEFLYYLPLQLRRLQRDSLDAFTPDLADKVWVSPVWVYAQLADVAQRGGGRRGVAPHVAEQRPGRRHVPRVRRAAAE